MKKIILFVGGILAVGLLHAQDKAASDAQANNPLANSIALNLQNNYVTKLTNAPDEAYMNTSWIRYAQPFVKGKLLLRVSVPFSTVAIPNIPNLATGIVNTENGLGDMNAFLSYNFISKPTATMGVGPMVTAPTAAENLLGSGKLARRDCFCGFYS